jgi:hypothetical protein
VAFPGQWDLRNSKFEKFGVCRMTTVTLYIGKGKGHPITGHQGPTGGVEV